MLGGSNVFQFAPVGAPSYNLQVTFGGFPLWYFRARSLALRTASGEQIEVERILAAARAALAVSSFFALEFFSSTPTFHYDGLVHLLLLLYSGHALALLVLLHVRSATSVRFTHLIHASDVLWPAVLSLFTNGPASPFFLYFIFALLAAAFRWGMQEALLTMLAAIAALLAEAIALTYLPLSANIAGDVTLDTLLLRIAYLITFAVLIGYLAESEKRRYVEALGISQVSAMARVDDGMKRSLRATLEEILRLFDGRELWLVTSEGRRSNVSRVEKLPDTGEVIFTWRRLEDFEAEACALEMPEQSAGAHWQDNQSASTDVVDSEGNFLRGRRCHLSLAFAGQHAFQRLLLSMVSFPPHIVGRLFLFDPKLGGGPRTQLRFLQQLTTRIAPGVYNVYLLRRLRSRIAAAERARMARELHDGVVQTLHGLAFRLYALRTAEGIDPKQRQELLELQELVQSETAVLRSLIQQLKPLDFDPRHLVEFLTGLIERFGDDTGIKAEFVCDAGDLTFPAATCREIAGIVQEALANVLKHSGAEKVLVRLGSQQADWILAIEDDGRGFEFSGRLSQVELEKMRRGPLVIQERVRAIGGELTIDSKPGQGTRLEIRFPQPALPTFA
jgi:signal transduction histidine kinase